MTTELTTQTAAKARDIDLHSLSNNDSEFFYGMLKLFIETLSTRHNLDLNKLSKGDLERFITHIDQAKPDDFTGNLSSLGNDKILLSCKTSLSSLLNNTLQDIGVNSFVRIVLDEEPQQANTFTNSDQRARNSGLNWVTPISFIVAMAVFVAMLPFALLVVLSRARTADKAGHDLKQIVKSIVEMSTPPGPVISSNNFQSRVGEWLVACFGQPIADNRIERVHRYCEESIELIQALGCTRSEVIQLVDYVFNRPVGDPQQEVGGVMVTLAALCRANNIDMYSAGETELARVWHMMDVIRQKQANKPQFSPLPGESGYPDRIPPVNPNAPSNTGSN